MDFPAEDDVIVTMYAGDCDHRAENRRVTYSLSDIQFEFLDADRGYSLDDAASDRVSTAFQINSSGAVTPALTSYRPYSFGRFVLTVVAADSEGRTDTSELKVGLSRVLQVNRCLFHVQPAGRVLRQKRSGRHMHATISRNCLMYDRVGG